MPSLFQAKRDALALAFLVTINFATFFSHYTGSRTFPWDFLGGYHALAYAWFADGGFFSPPEWFPWSEMGFPAVHAIQDSAWHLPVALLDLLNIPYTIEAATIIQCLYVLFGSVGLYYLLKSYGLESEVAALGAVCLHFSANFYSNAQHIDIIRGAAYLPWLLLLLKPSVLARGMWPYVAAVVVLFQFLVVVYPGIIVSSVYSVGVVTIISLLYMWPHRGVGRTLVLLASVGVPAVLMSGLKWLPLILQGNVAAVEVDTGYAPILPTHLFTLLLPYDREFIPGDVTMRSLWLPAVVFLGILMPRRFSYVTACGVALALIGFVFGGLLPGFLGRMSFLPGLSISRFPISDWRPALHIGLIILSCEGWQTLLRSERPLVTFTKPFVFFTATFIVVSWVASYSGYAFADFRLTGFTLTALFFAGSGVIIILSTGRNFRKISAAVFPVVTIAAATSGLIFHLAENRPWRTVWNTSLETSLFGMRVADGTDDRPPRELARRPERLVVGDNQEQIVANSNSALYNQCYYQGTYCLLGYNNNKLSLANREWRRYLFDQESGPALVEFSRRKQQLVVLPEGFSFDPNELPDGDRDAQILTSVPNVIGRIVSYSNQSVSYEISTDVPVAVIENEIWAAGWKLQLCKGSECLAPMPTGHTDEYLRTWNVPPGEWLVNLQYEQNIYTIPWTVFGFGFAFMIGFSTFVYAGSWRRSNYHAAEAEFS